MQWIHNVPLGMSLHCVPVGKTVLPKPFQDATLLALSVWQSLLFTDAVLGAPRAGGGWDSHGQAGDKEQTGCSDVTLHQVHQVLVGNIWSFWRQNCNIKWSDFILSYIFTPHPYPELACELQWPVLPKLETASTFVFIGLFEDVSVHPNYEAHGQAAGLSTSSCHIHF